MPAGAPTTVTILFCDLVGSSAILAGLDEQTQGLRLALFAALRRAVATHNGREVKSLGDGLMVAFPSAVEGLAAGGAMQQAVWRLDRRGGHALRLRVGISTGDASHHDEDYFGPPVVEASRLCDAAAPGQILVGGATVAVAGGAEVATRVQPLGDLALRGLPRPLPAFEVPWAPPAPSAPFPAALGREPQGPFVGRAGQLAQLRAGLARATQGRRQTLLVSGEPGIGKTRLVSQAAASAHRDGAIVLYGRCDLELGVAYQPFTEALRDLVAACDEGVLEEHVAVHGPELRRLVPGLAARVAGLGEPAVGEPEGDRLRLFEAVDHLLSVSSRDAPVVLVLDDVHWAAGPTLLLWRHLARSQEPASLALVATLRDTELGPEHPLVTTVADLRRIQGVERLDLDGLDEPEVAELLEQALDRDSAGRGLTGAQRELAGRIRAETGGNPYFVQEIVSHLAEAAGRPGPPDGPADGAAIPESVRDVVRGRLARLAAPTRDLLTVAAVMGTDFAVDVLSMAAGRDAASPWPASEMDEAFRQRLVVDAAPGRPGAGRPGAGGWCSFAHEIVRATIYGDLPATRRAFVHLQVARATEARTGPGRSGEETAALAHHFTAGAAAGGGSPAAEYSLQAARQALLQLAYEQAVDVLERVLAAVEGDRSLVPATRCDLLLALAEARAHTFDHAGVQEAAGRASDLARLAASPERLAQAAIWYGARPVAGEGGAVGVALTEEALAAIGPQAVGTEALLLASLAVQRSFAGAGADSDAASKEALQLAARSGDRQAQARAAYARYHTLWGTPAVEEQLALAGQLRAADALLAGGLSASLEAERLRVFPLLALGRRDDFMTAIATVEQVGEDFRSRYFRAAAAMWRGCQALLEGRFSDFDGGLGLAGQLVGDDPNFSHAIGGQIFQRTFESGRLPDLVGAVEAMVQRAPGLTGFQAALALCHLEAGNDAEARSLFDNLARGGFGAVARDLAWPPTMAVLAEVCVGLGDGAAAAELAMTLEPYRGTLVVLSAAYCPGAADRYLGMLALARHEPDAAEAHLRAALDLEAGMAARPLVARTQGWLAQALLAQARRHHGQGREEGLRLAAGALAEATDLGMAGLGAQMAALVGGA